MQDANWKTWALVILLGFGAFAELIKHFPVMGKGGMPWESETTRIGTVGQPYSVKLVQGRDRQQKLQPSTRIGALNGGITREQLQKFVAANSPQATTFDNKDKGAEGTKKDAKKDEEKCDETQPPKIDPKTGKPVACKKKKKKKEEDKAEATLEQPKSPSSDDHKGEIDNALAQAAGSGQIPQPLPNPNQADVAFDTLENWERRLLNSPDLAETKVFIDHYQRNLVTADVFYKVTQEMLDDSRTDMRSLGVLCAGLTPSVVSFQLLAGVMKSERPDSAVATQANEFLSRYSDLGNVGVLERVLRSPSASYATVLATQRLGTAARRYLTVSASSTTNPSSQTTGQAQASAQHAKNVTYFTRFVSILQDLERSTDSTVAAQSRATLSDLQALLGTAPASTTPTTPTTTVSAQTPDPQTQAQD